MLLFKSFLHVVECRGKGGIGALIKGSMVLFLLDLSQSHAIKMAILDEDLEVLSLRGVPISAALDFLGLNGTCCLLFARHGGAEELVALIEMKSVGCLLAPSSLDCEKTKRG